MHQMLLLLLLFILALAQVSAGAVCTCDNGDPATGEACTSDGAKCASCNTGYQANGDACELAGCTDSTKFNFNPLASTDDGSCVDKVDGDFEKVSSGKCTDHGRYVATYEECQTAMVSLVLMDADEVQFIRTKNWYSQKPRGCYQDSWPNGWNTASSSSADCGAGGADCICVAQSQFPACANTGGTAIIAEISDGKGGFSTECGCGSTTCNNGQICTVTGDTGICSCPSHFTGDNCETAVPTEALLSALDCAQEPDAGVLPELANRLAAQTCGT